MADKFLSELDAVTSLVDADLVYAEIVASTIGRKLTITEFAAEITKRANDGTLTAPGMAFIDDPNNGFYRIGTDNWAAAAAGVKIWETSKDGELTMPLQPAFIVNPASTQSNIAVGSAVTVVWGTEVKDIGGNFASNTFTAPVTGIYLFCVLLDLAAIDSAATTYEVRLVTTNRTYNTTYDPTSFSADLQWNVQLTIHADMEVSETATVQILQTGGAAQTDVGTDSRFSGHLVA